MFSGLYILPVMKNKVKLEDLSSSTNKKETAKLLPGQQFVYIKRNYTQDSLS
uniref:Uncharacterized protein n=1 Tax=Octopus bimaculoides TaxID=37653 RepID=A0A0L8GEI4_OCTBM